MLGTNIDTLQEGPKMGFSPQTCLNYTFSTDGGVNALRSTSNAIGRYTEYNNTPELQNNDFEGYTQDERNDSECIERNSMDGGDCMDSQSTCEDDYSQAYYLEP